MRPGLRVTLSLGPSNVSSVIVIGDRSQPGAHRLAGFDLGPHDPGAPVALLDRQMREPPRGLSSKAAALRRRLIEMGTFRVYRYESTTIIVDHGATFHQKGRATTRLRRRRLARQVPEPKEICGGQ